LGILLAAYASTSVPAAPTPIVSNSHTSRVDPAAQSVLDYLRAHSIVQSLRPTAALLDPAQQGVMDYLRVHGAEHPRRAVATPWDPAVQAVLDYPWAHSR